MDVARLVMEKTCHVMLVGEGAKQFANEQGVPDVPIGQLVTEFASQSLEEVKNGGVTATTELGYVTDFFQLMCNILSWKIKALSTIRMRNDYYFLQSCV